MLLLDACAISYGDVGLGRLGGRVVTMWVGEDKFIYVPAPKGGWFYFETAQSGKLIEPGLMYTDGGSIPRFARAWQGFSPWGFGPAYVIHDWIFYGHHCVVDGRNDGRFNDVKDITFDESALILAQVIKTLVDHGQVPENAFATDIISNAVDSTVARALWDKGGACEPSRVTPWHIAVAWKALIGVGGEPPRSWKLAKWEIDAARKLLNKVPNMIGPDYLAPSPAPIARRVSER
jgi:hypothetical protein